MDKISPSKRKRREWFFAFLSLAALNTAGADALCTLPGVGESRARAILEYREQHGPFEQVEDAANVPGLTEEIVASWEGQATVH